MKIADLFRYIGRKHLEGVVTARVTIAAGTKVYVRHSATGYELHTQQTADAQREQLKAGGSSSD